MKKLIYLLLVLPLNSFAQDLRGTWRLISYEGDRLEYRNDSVYRHSSLVKDTDEPVSQMVLNGFKETSIEFTTKSRLVMNSAIFTSTSSRYELDEINKKIILKADPKAYLTDREWFYEYEPELGILNIYMAEGMKLRFRKE